MSVVIVEIVEIYLFTTAATWYTLCKVSENKNFSEIRDNFFS